MKNLNKENFWDELHSLYPAAVEHFCKWIDEYKKGNNWNQLFNAGAIAWNGDTVAPKFHELPFEMQNGIIARYELELFNNGKGKGKEIADNISENYKVQVKNLFADLQKNINKRNSKLN